MEILKISYTIWRKHGDIWYCRVRQPGTKCFDVNLHTTDRSQAEAFIRLRKAELELYNSYVRMGEDVPDDVARKLLRRDSPSLPQKGPSKAPELLTSAMDGWEKDLRRRGLREASITSYMKQVALTVPSGATLAEVTRSNVRVWLSKHDHLKSASRKLYSVALREFAKYLINERGLPTEILLNWPMTKVEQEEKGYLTIQQVAKVINCVRCTDKIAEQSYKAYFWFLFVTGARQREAGLLEWKDIVQGSIVLRAENTKSGVSRRVPVEPRVLEMVMRLPHDSQLVFSHIAPSQPRRYAVLARAAKEAGVQTKTGLHTLRHSASMYLYAHCSDIKLVSQMLGHSPAVALKYYQSSREDDQMREVVSKSLGTEILLPDSMDELIKAGLW